MTQKKIAATIQAALVAANGTRRDRLAEPGDVRSAVNDALKTGVGHKMAATVPAAYKYTAHGMGHASDHLGAFEQRLEVVVHRGYAPARFFLERMIARSMLHAHAAPVKSGAVAAPSGRA